ncbi:uncharacterized protein LOC116349571 [Contarinia nasturtii]|uniref:uncharacterized protein LOC116349571 n=1 Tax=Contarinia nasturtii TaxID=265458 RepID=UPI0012D43B25|nr:uncharacterized protein LOC116349571 [Contarinia nasturtii]
MRTVYANCRRMTIIYTCMYTGAIMSLFSEVIFLERSDQTWKSTAPIPSNWAQQTHVYYGVLIFEAFSNSLNCAISWTLDTSSLKLVSLLCGHIEVLSLHLKQIGKSGKISKDNSNHVRLLAYLDHYKLLNKYSNEINMYLSAIFFIQIMKTAYSLLAVLQKAQP